MPTYARLFATAEFPPLFALTCAQNAATTVGGLALATTVYAGTGSPLLSALSMFGPQLAQLAGALLLGSAADRLPPRAALTAAGLVFALCAAALAAPGLPAAAIVAVLLVQGVTGSIAGGVRYGLLTDILGPQGFVLGRSTLNIATGTMQIAGFAAGGLLLVVLSPRQTLLLAGALFLVAALLARVGLTARPARALGRPTPRETWRVNRMLLTSPRHRYLYLALWVPNGFIVGCEALFVPYEPERAGVLLAAAAGGMLAGDVLTGRFLPPAWRDRLATPLRLLLAVPYLVFALDPPLPVAAVAVAVASVGYSGSLVLQERLVSLGPDDVRGQALGLQGSGLMAMQAVGAGLAGLAAEVLSPAGGITVMAVASIVVTVALAPRVGARTGAAVSARPTGPDGP